MSLPQPPPRPKVPIPRMPGVTKKSAPKPTNLYYCPMKDCFHHFETPNKLTSHYRGTHLGSSSEKRKLSCLLRAFAKLDSDISSQQEERHAQNATQKQIASIERNLRKDGRHSQRPSIPNLSIRISRAWHCYGVIVTRGYRFGRCLLIYVPKSLLWRKAASLLARCHCRNHRNCA